MLIKSFSRPVSINGLTIFALISTSQEISGIAVSFEVLSQAIASS